MSAARRTAFTLYGLIALASLGFGLVYLTRDSFQPYHADAVGMPFDSLEPPLQVLILALMKVAAGGWLALVVFTVPLLLGPFRKGDRLTRFAIPLGLLACYGPTLWATLMVLTQTPATPPWYGAATACASILLAVALDRPWQRVDAEPAEAAAAGGRAG